MTNLPKFTNLFRSNFAFRNKGGWTVDNTLELKQDAVFCLYTHIATRYFLAQAIADELNMSLESMLFYASMWDRLSKTERVRTKLGLVENKIRLEG